MALPCGAMGCLRFVIVVFPDHTHLLFFITYKKSFIICSFVHRRSYTLLTLVKKKKNAMQFH